MSSYTFISEIGAEEGTIDAGLIQEHTDRAGAAGKVSRCNVTFQRCPANLQ